MSFTENPYYTLTVSESVSTGKIHWVCDSCGGQSKTGFDSSTPVDVIWNDFIDHIRNSHRRTPSDFEGWGTRIS